jgi:hypothetical protein
MQETDFNGLPDDTKRLVQRLINLGLDRDRIFGFFVMVGLYAGSPNTQEKIEQLFSRLSLVLPTDRSQNIDEAVGHLYRGYDKVLNEFCYRSGLISQYFGFREIKMPPVDKVFYIAYLQDEGVLETDVTTCDKLSNATELYDAFILALGKTTTATNANLIEAFTCGMFQIQLHGASDVHGAMRISEAISTLMPPLLGRCFQSVISGQTQYFLGLESGQLALLSSMQSMSEDYVRKMWAFQSYLFFRDGQPINGVSELTEYEWHDWVIKNAIGFSDLYPKELTPFSASGIKLDDLPTWNYSVRSFEVCDDYINVVWGYSAKNLNNIFHVQEYRALLVHVVYASLSSSREATY